MDAKERLRAAQVVLPCEELQPTIDFFVERLGMQLERITPADDPREAVVVGHGLALRLRRGAAGAPGALRIACADPAAFGAGARELRAPNGTVVELVADDAEPSLPPLRPELVVARASDAPAIRGRAGMHYRDLIPGRLGGRWIASHIALPDGGPVPDHVHHHAVRFQMIYCARGWVRVVYEDQGPPFTLSPGDCVLQPPHIRHRVLESSPGCEVIELASPAEHDTLLDHDLALPTADLRPDRDFGGQRFVRHEVRTARWVAVSPELEARDTGIAAATNGLADVRVARAVRSPAAAPLPAADELCFLYVLAGSVVLEGATDEPLPLAVGDSVALPPARESRIRAGSADLELLEVRFPGETVAPAAPRP